MRMTNEEVLLAKRINEVLPEDLYLGVHSQGMRAVLLLVKSGGSVSTEDLDSDGNQAIKDHLKGPLAEAKVVRWDGSDTLVFTDRIKACLQGILERR